MKKTPLIIILPDIRSAMNVGAILRTADGVNAQKVYFTGYTATPLHPKVNKTSLGAEAFVDWEYVENETKLIKNLKNDGYQIIGLEITEKASTIWESNYIFPVALVVGNEIHGISNQTRELCDNIVFIPMLGSKESLNVATSAGIASYEILRQYRLANPNV